MMKFGLSLVMYSTALLTDSTLFVIGLFWGLYFILGFSACGLSLVLVGIWTCVFLPSLSRIFICYIRLLSGTVNFNGLIPLLSDGAAVAPVYYGRHFAPAFRVFAVIGRCLVFVFALGID